MAMEDNGEADPSQLQLYLREKGLRFTELALLVDSRRRAGGGIEKEEADELLNQLQICLRGKGLPFTELALQVERGGGMEGEQADNFLDELPLYLRSKKFNFTALALQDERSRRAGGAMVGEEAEKLLREFQLYLHRKGFSFTEVALLEERSRRATTYEIGVSRTTVTRRDNYTRELYQGYEKLKAWVKDSPDNHKHEFLRVLYLLFVLCSMDLVLRGCRNEARAFFSAFAEDHQQTHPEELNKLKPFFLTTRNEEMDLPEYWSKAKLRVSEHSYELILKYLHGTNANVLLGLINESIKFEVYAGQPGVFPLGKETLADMIRAGSAAALVAISALNLIAAKIEDCDGYALPLAFASTLPYTYLPFGLVCVALGVGAVKNKGLIDYAAGCFFFQFIYLIWLGGIRVLACHKVDVLGVVNKMLCSVLIFSILWSYCCAHPKWLRCYGERAYGCLSKWIDFVCMWATRPRATRAVKAAYGCSSKWIGYVCVWVYRCCTRPRATRAVRAAYGCSSKWIGFVCEWVYRCRTRPRATRVVQPAGTRSMTTGLPSARLKQQ